MSPDAQPLNRGKASAVPIGAGQTLTGADIEVAGMNELSLGYEMTGANNADLVVQLNPFKSDGVTPLSNITVPPVYSNGPTHVAGVVQFTATYDVSGYSKVRISAKNNNAGAQTINDFWWRAVAG
jgi:hypothetical protein